MIDTQHSVIDDFHRLHYEGAAKGQGWGSAHWHGVKLWKNPTDLWLYQELIHEIRPALIIETGTAFGGSALYFAHQFDQIGHGHVVTIDLKPYSKDYPRHRRITYISGKSSVRTDVLTEVERLVEWAGGPVLVSLDSDHSEKHVRDELEVYAPLVTAGSYLIVEDTNVNGHPVYPEHGPGPWEAVEAWLPSHPEFVEDTRIQERWLFSYHRWFKKRRS